MENTYDFTVAHPETFKQLSLKDSLFVYYKCPQVDKLVKLYTHFNQISFTLSGKKTFHQGGKSWTVTDERSLFIRKTAFIQEMYKSVGWEVLAFYFQDDLLFNTFREYRKYIPLKKLPPPPEDMLIEININDTTRAFFYSIVPYFNQKVPPNDSLLEIKFKELLFNIFSDPSNIDLIAYINSITDQHRTPLWQVMEANYMFNLSIAEYARIAGRSVASLKREFRNYYKTTPGKWLTQKRLEHAKMLLTTSKKNISEVAYDSGFENISHFSRIFKEKYRLSPLIYRKQL